MGWVHDALVDFGRQMGLPDLAFGSHGVLQLRLESGAQLAVEQVRRGKNDEVVVYFARPLASEVDGLCRRALEKTHFAQDGPYPVQLAMRGEGVERKLLLLVRVPERLFTLQTLAHVVDYLDHWFADLRDGR